MINALIFDINGVLNSPTDTTSEKNILNSFGVVISELENLGLKAEDNREELYEIYHKSSVNLNSREKMVQQMSDLLLCESDAFINSIHSIYSEGAVENESLYNFLVSVADKNLLKIGLLSTQFPLSKDVLVPQKYFEHFDSFGISCDSMLHLKKPEEDVFQKALEELDTKPEEAIFVDDQLKCVNAGNQLGINSIQFVNNKQLADDLVKFDIPNEVAPLLHTLN